jgi:hypothetical protein
VLTLPLGLENSVHSTELKEILKHGIGYKQIQLSYVIIPSTVILYRLLARSFAHDTTLLYCLYNVEGRNFTHTSTLEQTDNYSGFIPWNDYST